MEQGNVAMLPVLNHLVWWINKLSCCQHSGRSKSVVYMYNERVGPTILCEKIGAFYGVSGPEVHACLWDLRTTY